MLHVALQEISIPQRVKRLNQRWRQEENLVFQKAWGLGFLVFSLLIQTPLEMVEAGHWPHHGGVVDGPSRWGPWFQQERAGMLCLPLLFRSENGYETTQTRKQR